MDKKFGEFVGVDQLHYAIVSQDDETGYVAGAPKYLAPAAEISAETETNNTPTYYDNKPGNNYVSEGITTVTITVSNIPVILAAELLGKDYDAATGTLIDDGQPNPPDVALAYRANIGRSDHRHSWYYKGTFSGGAEEAASKTSDVDIRTYQLTYTAVATTHEWMVNGTSKSLKKRSGDTTDPAFDPTGWFTQVQTPDVSGAPAALTLASSVPVDGAPAVAVGANVVLTFSNKIASHAVTLLDETLAIVPAAFSFDVTGKILTINPSADLSATTTYAVVVNGVRDIYGQQLTNQVIDFTTA